MSKQKYLHHIDEDITLESIIQIILGFFNNDKSKLIAMLEQLDIDVDADNDTISNNLVDCTPVKNTAFFKILEDFDIIQYGVSIRCCWLGPVGLEILKLLKDE